MTYRPNAAGWSVEGENFVRLNGLGMRDRERSVDGSNSRIGIALLGDSMVAALQVPFEDTMGQVLERRLNSETPGGPYDVLNFAVGGFSLAQEYLMFHHRILRFHPKILVLFLSPTSVPSCSRKLYRNTLPTPYFTIQNGELAFDDKSHAPPDATPEGRRRHAIKGDLLNRVMLIQLMNQALVVQEGLPDHWNQILVALHLNSAHSKSTEVLASDKIWFQAPSNEEAVKSWNIAEAILGRMADEAHQAGIELWIAPDGPEVEDSTDAGERAKFFAANGFEQPAYAEQRFKSFALAHGIHYIDLENQLLAHVDQTHIPVRGFFNTTPNHGHWNIEGNTSVANILDRELSNGSQVLREQIAVPSSVPPLSERSAVETSVPQKPPPTIQHR
jgi:hypothetical protein